MFLINSNQIFKIIFPNNITVIIQWVILAVRNITENNDENKRTIAEMTKIGVVNTSTLREMGLALHDDGSNKIFMMPLDVNK